MAGIVDICNRALSKLGQTRITALTDDRKSAKACNHAYPIVRKAVLRKHPWSCTVARAQLAPISTAPAFEYDYSYQMPSDCLRLLDVDTTYDWVVESRKILSNEGTVLNIRYQMDEEDPNQFDSLLFEVMAARLCYEIAEEMTQSNTKKAEALKDYKELLSEAKMIDSQEQSPGKFSEDGWINARF